MRHLAWKLGVITIVAASLACQVLTPAKLKHYEDQWVSFDYPSNWKTFSELKANYRAGFDPEFGAQELGGVGLPKSAVVFSLYRKDIPPETSLQEIYEQTYQNMVLEVVPIQEDETSLNGLLAYEKIYKQPHGEPWYQFKDLWIEKNGQAFILSCQAYPSSFEKYQEEFRTIVDSFQLK